MKKVILYTILIITAISMLLPFLAMILISLSGDEQIFINFKNINLNFCSYYNVFESIPVMKYFLNSLIVAFFTTVGQVIVSASAGYGFARFTFPGRNILFFVIIMTMMVPPQVNIVPLFWLMSKFEWIDSYQALIVPGIFGGFGVFMMRQYFQGFSSELEDASKIDGCNPFQTFFRIVLPCAIPAIVTLSIFTFVTAWNSFMWPLIAVNSENMRTLAVGLAIFKGSFRELTLWGELMAGACLCSIPVILIFILGKKYLINNPLEGAVKE